MTSDGSSSHVVHLIKMLQRLTQADTGAAELHDWATDHPELNKLWRGEMVSAVG